jgi:hypothetical protein
LSTVADLANTGTGTGVSTTFLRGASDNAEHFSLFVLVIRAAILPFQSFIHIKILVVKIKHHHFTMNPASA